MATNLLFERLFVWSKSRYNMYIDGFIIKDKIIHRTSEPDHSLLLLRGIKLNNWETLDVDFAEWEFTNEAWFNAELDGHKILIEDYEGDKVEIEFWFETEMVL